MENSIAYPFLNLRLGSTFKVDPPIVPYNDLELTGIVGREIPDIVKYDRKYIITSSAVRQGLPTFRGPH
jgi:hypothetical protein